MIFSTGDILHLRVVKPTSSEKGPDHMYSLKPRALMNKVGTDVETQTVPLTNIEDQLEELKKKYSEIAIEKKIF